MLFNFALGFTAVFGILWLAGNLLLRKLVPPDIDNIDGP